MWFAEKKIADKCMENSSQVTFKLGEYNSLPGKLILKFIHKLCKIQFWKRLFAFGFAQYRVSALSRF